MKTFPRVTFLIGLPASGKSTWREASRSGAYVASSDDFIEAMAKEAGQTYNEAFQANIKSADMHFQTMVSHAISEGKDLIIDRTNLTVNGRRKLLSRIPFEWTKVAILFVCRDFETWKARLMNRPGKTIPVGIIENMRKVFEAPTQAEGFHEVLTYET